MSVSRGQSSRAASSACVRPAARRAAAIRRPTVRLRVSWLLRIEVQESKLFASHFLAGQLFVGSLNEVNTVVVLCCGQVLILCDVIALLEYGPAAGDSGTKGQLFTVNARLRPDLDELVDVTTLCSGDRPRLPEVRFKLSDAILVIFPCLPRLILALFQCLLALGDALNGIIKALKVAQILNRTARPFREAGRAGNHIIDLPDAEEPQVAQSFLDDGRSSGSVDRTNPGRHEFQDEKFLLLRSTRSHNTKSLHTVAQIGIRTDAPNLRVATESDSVA